jgi:hypothetical protein
VVFQEGDYVYLKVSPILLSLDRRVMQMEKGEMWFFKRVIMCT